MVTADNNKQLGKTFASRGLFVGIKLLYLDYLEMIILICFHLYILINVLFKIIQAYVVSIGI